MYSLPLLTNALEIGTAKYPLRASALPKLLICPARVFLDQNFWITEDHEETAGEAAQTGNLVHSGAAWFHQNPNVPLAQRQEGGREALQNAQSTFPLGDAKRAEEIFKAYSTDKKNIEAEVVKCEERVVCRIPCVPWDITGQPVYVRGTLDQVRRINGVNKVFDIKTGKMYYGQKAIDHYLTQQAAYTLGAYQTFGFPVEPGALICTDGYFRKKGKVFWSHPWYFEDIEELLLPIAIQVAAARQKKISHQSGDECYWCPFKKITNCLHFKREHLT